MINKDKISIIIPVYNVEKYLATCMNSIINQTYLNIEIILINDGSTDNSSFICDQYKKKDDRIILIHQKHQGTAAAKNKGLDIAAGDYICFVYGDNWIENDMLETLYKNISEFNTDISMCRYLYVGENNEIINNESLKSDCFIKTLKRRDVLRHYSYYRSINDNVCCKLYKRFLFDKIRFPANKINEDVYITYLLLGTAQKMVILDECKYYLRYKSGNIYSPEPLKAFDMIELIIRRYEYIKSIYPEFEPPCRRNLLMDIGDILSQMAEIPLNIYTEEINKIIGVIKEFDIYNCQLDEDRIKFFELFLKGNRGWVLAIKISNRKKTNLNNNLAADTNIEIEKKEKAVLEYYEYHISDHCNLNCKGCTHFCNILEQPRFADYEQYCKDLKALSRMYWNISTIRLMGGEPLLNPKLPDFIKTTREIFPESYMVVVTNGLLLPKADDRLFETMRNFRCELIISIYEPTYAELGKIKDILKKNNIKWKSSTFFIPVESFDKSITMKPVNPVISHKACKLKQCRFLCDGYLYPCIFPAKKHILEERFKIKIGDSDIEKMRINLHKTTLSGWEINEFLEKPIELCSACATIEEESFQWKSKPSKNAKLSDWFVGM